MSCEHADTNLIDGHLICSDCQREVPSAACEHGYAPGECPEDGCLYRREVRNSLLGLAGSMTAAGDQAQAMTDRELGECLLGLNGKRWTTIEIHEAGRRLIGRG